jgi:hypothetical protein
MSSVGYFDVVILCAAGLLGTSVMLFVSRSIKRSMLFLIKWAVAFIVLNAIVTVLTYFPGYAIVRDAVAGSISRVILGNADGKAIMEVVKEELRRMAKKHIMDAANAKSDL